ncbi:MAG: hypothetical protein NTU61_05090 [Candidatus Altiarchaeota archaeon]|nr:hypothetical protein [Candidatus Altiarchaeota archaeon]
MKPNFNVISTNVKGEPEMDEGGNVKYYGSAFLDWKTFGPTIGINVDEDITAGKWLELVPRKGFDFRLTRVSGDEPSFSVKIGRLTGTKEQYCGVGWGLRRKGYDTYYIRLKMDTGIEAGRKLFCNPRKGEADMFIKPDG